MDKIRIPYGPSSIISTLTKAGFEAYVVGGCVRDSLLGLMPHDWDICTNATPEEVISCFSDRRVIETGLKHGTVTLVMEDGQYEVTTFRSDGVYSDGRHPDSVTFTSSIAADLARRDFTINAMAYNEYSGLIDPHDGKRALERGIIACVGSPGYRFGEDGLRIMRALRFASTYGFTIEPATANAIHAVAPLLENIAAERIWAELGKLLLGKNVLRVLLGYSDVIATIIPELKPCIGFEQNNPYHQYTVYDHIAHAVANNSGDDISVKLALLLHDIGKPMCYTEDENGGHFRGHGVYSRDIAETVISRLRLDNKTKGEVLELVLYHDALIEPTPKTVRRWLNRIGEEQFRRLLTIRMADIGAHAEGTQQHRLEQCEAVRAVLEEVLAQEQCFSLRDMSVNGNDILALGIPEGKAVGEVLNVLLDSVISGELPNEREKLINRAVDYLERTKDTKG